MLKEMIEKIVAMAEPNLITMGERDYTDKTVHGIQDPMPHALSLHTLTGLIDWLNSDDYKDCMIQILGPRSVDVIGKLEAKWMQRKIYIDCKLLNRDGFRFGQFMEIEDFIINFQCNFTDSDTKKRIIDYLANIRDENVTTAEDDGIAQEVTISNKIGRLEKSKMNPIVKLAPFRTFTEIKQPPSLFLLRLRQQKDSMPLVALFEADGGAWKNDAILSIAKYLLATEVVREKGIDVLA